MQMMGGVVKGPGVTDNENKPGKFRYEWRVVPDVYCVTSTFEKEATRKSWRHFG